jgi:hypothetical protein
MFLKFFHEVLHIHVSTPNVMFLNFSFLRFVIIVNHNFKLTNI